jgi:hypothetical protein
MNRVAEQSSIESAAAMRRFFFAAADHSAPAWHAC